MQMRKLVLRDYNKEVVTTFKKLGNDMAQVLEGSIIFFFFNWQQSAFIEEVRSP